MIDIEDYKRIDNVALNIRKDYDILKDYFDIENFIKEILKIKLVPYKNLDEKTRKMLIVKYGIKDALTIRKEVNGKTEIIIYYDDEIDYRRIRFSLAHELKHVIFEEKNPNEDEEKLADHFAKVLLAPSCLVINYIDKDEQFISKEFGISNETARYSLESAKKRKNSYLFSLNEFERVYLLKIDFSKKGGNNNAEI